jgi:hypothetical protein
MQVKQTLDEACIKENNDILLFFHFILMDTPENKQVAAETDIIDETEKGLLLSVGCLLRNIADRVIQMVGITEGGTGKSEGAVQQHPGSGDILVQLGSRGERKIHAATLDQKGWWKDPFTLEHVDD